eukprot:Awhi_evm1s3786
MFSIFMKRGENGFGYNTTAEEVTANMDLSGKTFLITGINSGLGCENGRVLALRNGNIIGLAGTKEKATVAMQEWKGIMALPTLELTPGSETQLFTFHVGHFILINSLISVLSETARVVLLSSHSREPTMAITEGNTLDNLDDPKDSMMGQSKVAPLFMAKSLAKQFEGTKKTAYSCYPGMIQTIVDTHVSPFISGVTSFIAPAFCKSIPEGAATQVYLATADGIEKHSGKYFADCNVELERDDGTDIATAEMLWEVTEGIIQEINYEI